MLPAIGREIGAEQKKIGVAREFSIERQNSFLGRAVIALPA